MKHFGWTIAAFVAMSCGGSTIDGITPESRDAGGEARHDADAAPGPDRGGEQRDAAFDVSTDPPIERGQDALPEHVADVAVDPPSDVGVDRIADVAIDQGSDGGCPNDCRNLPNVQPGALVECRNGRCVVPQGSCLPGFAHCSLRPEDGCETDISQPSNCGGCGRICYGGYRCEHFGTTYSCVQDCPPSAPDPCLGFCVDLSSDTSHCGACGHSCASDNPHADVSCIKGQCKIDRCFDGFGDCTSDPGCESRLDTADNCGVCGRKTCSFANATSPCVTTGCGEPVCQPGFANCDHASLDCESPIASAACWPKYLGTAAFGGAPNLGSIGTTATAILPDGTHFVGGDFGRVADFDPGPGLDVHTPVGAPDAFVAKLNPDGTLAWAKTFGGTNLEQVLALAAGPDGSVVAAGFYVGTVDFDPGPGVDTHSSTTDESQEPFVVKFAGDGSFLWARTFSLIDYGRGNARAVAVASDGSVYVGGDFTNGIDLDPGAETVEKDAPGNGFLVKLTSGGTFMWGRALGGPDCNSGNLWGMAVASDGNLWTTGTLSGTCPLDTSDPDQTDNADRTFVAGFTASGNYQRSWRFSAYGDNRMISLAADNSIYVGGSFTGVVDFDPGPSATERGSGTGSEGEPLNAGYAAKFGKDGTFRWVVTFPSLLISSVAATSDGVLALGGINSTTGDASGTGLTKIDANGISIFSANLGGMQTYAGQIAASGTRFVVVGTTDGLADFDPGPGTDIVDKGAVNFASRYSF